MSILLWYFIIDYTEIQYNRINHDTYMINLDSPSILCSMRTRKERWSFDMRAEKLNS
jgi:hypothetical protein